MGIQKIILLAYVCTAFLRVSSHADTTSTSTAQRWALVPILISNAETGVQVGALVMRFLNPEDTSNRPSTVGFSARISQKKQADIDLFPEWYLQNNRYHISADLEYIDWPAFFYGMDNDSSDIAEDSADHYLARGLSGNIMVEREWLPKLSVGPEVLFNYETVRFDSGASLVNSRVFGQHTSFTTGLGGVMTYDRRDAIYWARKGCFVRGKAAWYRNAWGSDFDYDSYSLEARQFIPVFATGALGFAATLDLKYGDVPFRDLSTPDGDKTMRGMVRGKYRDKDMLVLQSEYKSYLPDWSWLHASWIRKRLGWAMFAEAGQVAHTPDDFAWSEFRPGFGAGLRYAMNPAQRMNIRIDVGYVDHSIAPAINIKEAF